LEIELGSWGKLNSLYSRILCRMLGKVTYYGWCPTVTCLDDPSAVVVVTWLLDPERCEVLHVPGLLELLHCLLL